MQLLASSTGTVRGSLLLIAIALVGSATASSAHAETLIDTRTGWDGAYTFGSMCPSGAYGQTFEITEPTIVDSFSFFMKTTPSIDDSACEMDPSFCLSWDPIAFHAQLVAWDRALGTAVGPILYESSAVATTTDTLTEVAFDTAGLSLAPGTYVALINAAGLGNADNARGDIGIVPWYSGDPNNGGAWIDAYPAGDWVFSQCTDSVDPTQYTWLTQGVAMDTAFQLHGTSQPRCPDLSDANANGVPDALEAQCPCAKRQNRRQHAQCIVNAMYALMLDGCATRSDYVAVKHAASRLTCKR